MTKVLNNPSIDLKKEKGTVASIINKHKKILFDKIIPVGIKECYLVWTFHLYNDKKVAATAKKLRIKYTGHPNPVSIVLKQN
jgi:hypothetical protein